ncbi:hypothetical protein GL263_06610 [Streptomyces durbertensis]|uniref:ABC3 transporter permease C-terminal domain-containing protein n=1 Tax=Streptomyces durbertensis TaxID=2448886 RepID=A0ABR6ED41_9ACTN|nr:FtsX-like permease family protein [Streptomyces durbertensis]MBB1243237.1 hypothetical protein [Streptomyces durbertensis]
MAQPGELLTWVRVRLTSARTTALTLALVVAVTSFCLVLAPRVVEDQADRSLRHAVSKAALLERGVSGEAVPEQYRSVDGDFLTPDALDRVEAAFVRRIRPPLRFDPDRVAYGARNHAPAAVVSEGLPRPTPRLDPELTLFAQQGEITDFADVVRGRPPAGRVTGARDDRQVEAALTEATARRMKVSVGGVLTLGGAQGETRVTVTAVVRPKDRSHPYWANNRLLTSPRLKVLVEPGSDPAYLWEFGALLDRRAAPVLRDVRDGAVLYWHHPIDARALTADQVPAAQRMLTSLTSGAGATGLSEESPVGDIEVSSGLGPLLTAFERERDAVAPLVATASLGVGTAALIVLLMTAALGVERRREELSLLRARGCSLPALFGRLSAENAAVAVPAASLGTTLALLVAPGGDGSAGGALRGALLGLLVVLVATLSGPLRAVATHRTHQGTDRRDVVRARPSRRRTVAELTLLVLVGVAVAAVRGQGEGAGPLLAAAPVLLSLAAAIVLLRAYPLPLRLLGRAAARRRGPVLFLGLARAGRAPAGAGLPLLALLVTLTVAAFGGSVLTGVADARDRAALAAVGADARVADALGLPEEIKNRVDALPGVRSSLLVHADTRGRYVGRGSGTSFFVVIADPEEYAELARRTGLGPFPAEALRDDGGRTLPAVVSPGVARQLGENGRITVSGVPLDLRPVQTTDMTPAVTSGEFAIVSADAVSRLRDKPHERHLREPTMLLVTARDAAGGGLDAEALRTAAREVDEDSAVTVRAEERARLTDSPLQAGATGLYLAALGVALGYSVLALLLSLVQTAPERSRLLSRLRSMGLSKRQARGLLLVESLPQYALAVGGGVLVSAATVVLLRPGIDLRGLAGTTTTGLPAELPLNAAALALPALGVLALGCLTLLIQAWLMAGRRRPTEPRTVD